MITFRQLMDYNINRLHRPEIKLFRKAMDKVYDGADSVCGKGHPIAKHRNPGQIGWMYPSLSLIQQ